MNEIFYPSVRKVKLDKNNKLSLNDSKYLFNNESKNIISKILLILNKFEYDINENIFNEELYFLERVENAKRLFYSKLNQTNINEMELINEFIKNIELNKRNENILSIENKIPNSVMKLNEVSNIMNTITDDNLYNAISKYCNIRYQSVIVRIYKNFRLCAELSKSEYDDLIIEILESIKDKLRKDNDIENEKLIDDLLTTCKVDNINNKDKWRKIKYYSPKELKSIAQDNGYKIVSVRGSHYKFYNELTKDTCIIPMHATMSKSLSNSIYRKITARI